MFFSFQVGKILPLSGQNPFKNRFAVLNGRIRAVPPPPEQLDCKAINSGSTAITAVPYGTAKEGRNAKKDYR